jgi:hypothetical protein
MQVPVRLYKSLLPLLALMLLSSVAWANQAAYGTCALQGKVLTSALPSTNRALLAYPSCTVTVNVLGGSLATLYSDNLAIPTPLANPFTADTNGRWQFYAANGRYTITLSGAGMPSPVVYADVILNDLASGGTFISVDPWVDGRSSGIDCTGAADSSAAFVTWILNGHKRKEVPGDCKIKIQASAGVGAVITGIAGTGNGNGLGNEGWIDIYGGDGAEVFGCGAGSGAVLNFNRSEYFHFHGFAVQPTDTALCPGGSTFTRDIDWTNNNFGVGVTSTKAEFSHLQLIATGFPGGGGVLFPTVGSFGLVANAGNNVVYVNGSPSWPNMTFQQVTATNIVNTTAYSASVKVAISGSCCSSQFTGAATIAIGKCTATCTSTNPNGTNGAPAVMVLNSTPCTISSTNTWTTCTVNYTGTVGDAGNPIVIQLANSSTVASGKTNQVWFDNLTATGITITNPSFETLVGGVTLGSNQNLYPTVGSSWNWANYPQFIGMQIGSAAGEQNLEGLNLHDTDIQGYSNPGSVGLHNNGCCSEHNIIKNVGIFQLYRGLTGSWPWPVISALHGGGPDETYSNYQRFGIPYGALIASNIGGVLEDLNWDSFGPLYNSARDVNGTTQSATDNVAVFVHAKIDGTVTASGEYPIDISTLGTAVLDGGFAQNTSGAALNNSDNAFVGVSNYLANSCCGTVTGLQSLHLASSGLNGAVKFGSHVAVQGTVASGTATLGTGLISAGTCATVVTAAAKGVNPTVFGITLNDSISFAFTTAPSGAYTQGLTIQPYATTDNVNFLVCNGTSGSLTPPTKTISWSVTR